MSAELGQRPALDQLLARVLQRGTWLGSTVIALGLALLITGGPGASSAMMCTRIVTAGIALIIILPVLRVLLMLIAFVRERDFRFSAIATLVLAIILLSSALAWTQCWRQRSRNLCNDEHDPYDSIMAAVAGAPIGIWTPRVSR